MSALADMLARDLTDGSWRDLPGQFGLSKGRAKALYSVAVRAHVDPVHGVCAYIRDPLSVPAHVRAAIETARATPEPSDALVFDEGVLSNVRVYP